MFLFLLSLSTLVVRTVDPFSGHALPVGIALPVEAAAATG